MKISLSISHVTAVGSGFCNQKSFHTYLICFKTLDFQRTIWYFFLVPLLLCHNGDTYFILVLQSWRRSWFLDLLKIRALWNRFDSILKKKKKSTLTYSSGNKTKKKSQKMHLGLREIWVLRRSMSCILQGMLSNQPCTLLSFLHKRAEWISLWMAL